MNAIFAIIFVISTAILLVLSPENFLPALLGGATKAGTLCASLLGSYALWLGLMKLWEDSGVSRGVSRAMRPLARRLFKTDDPKTLDAVCMNLSVNLLGISGAATPYGIRAVGLLNESDESDYALSMFFVLNATSLQLIPTSIVGIRAALNSAAPADIILPTLLTTVFSTLLGAVAVRVFVPEKSAKRTENRPAKNFLSHKKKGVGIR